MRQVSAERLVSLLASQVLRQPTGLLLLPASWLGREREVALSLRVGYADHRAWLLRHLAPGQRFLGVNWRSLVAEDLTGLLAEATPDHCCLLVANLDLALTAVRAEERRHFWSNLHTTYRPHWGLLLTLPRECGRLLSADELAEWQREGRLAYWEED